jgi:hypothetical protein
VYSPLPCWENNFIKMSKWEVICTSVYCDMLILWIKFLPQCNNLSTNDLRIFSCNKPHVSVTDRFHDSVKEIPQFRLRVQSTEMQLPFSPADVCRCLGSLASCFFPTNWLAYSLTLKMYAVCSSEMSLSYRSMRRYVLRIHWCEKLGCSKVSTLCLLTTESQF